MTGGSDQSRLCHVNFTPLRRRAAVSLPSLALLVLIVVSHTGNQLVSILTPLRQLRGFAASALPHHSVLKWVKL